MSKQRRDGRPQIDLRFVCETLQWLVDSFPQSPPNFRVYAETLITVVMKANPTPAVLTAACWQIINHDIFLPPASVLRRAIEEQERIMAETTKTK